MPKTENLLTTAEVAAAFGVNVKTVNRWATTGRLPAAKKLPGTTGANLFDRLVVERHLGQRAGDLAGVAS